MLKILNPNLLSGKNLNHFMPYLNILVETMDYEVTAEQIIAAIRSQTIGLGAWYVPDEDDEGMEVQCYLIFEQEESEVGKALVISGFVGETDGIMGDWIPFHEQCLAIAKEAGCNRIKARGRRGLWRKYRELGFKESYSVYSFDIEDEET